MRYKALKLLIYLIVIKTYVKSIEDLKSFRSTPQYPSNYPFFLSFNHSTITNMDKKEKLRLKHNVKKFNYWEGWHIQNVETDEILLTIPFEKEKEVEKILNPLLDEFDKTGDYRLIPKCVELDRTTIYNFDHEIAELILEAGVNTEKKELLYSIIEAAIGDKSGSTDPKKLKVIATKDLKEFIDMVEKKFAGETYEDFTSNQDSTLKSIWTNYNKISKTLISGLNLDENSPKDMKIVFRILEAMIDKLDVAIADTEIKVNDSLTIVLIRN